jgi:hypothetical protein
VPAHFLTIKAGWKRHRSAYPHRSKKSWSLDRASTVAVNSRLPPIATSIPCGRHPRNIANSLQTERRPIRFYVWPASAPRCSPQSPIHSSPPPLRLAPRLPRPHCSPRSQTSARLHPGLPPLRACTSAKDLSGCASFTCLSHASSPLATTPPCGLAARPKRYDQGQKEGGQKEGGQA